VEADLGWRSSRAYPQEIFVPAIGARRRVGVERIIGGLSAYGVPVRVLGDVDTLGEPKPSIALGGRRGS
jgi:hypothetical protein